MAGDMREGRIAELSDRAAIAVTGDDAQTFLQGLLTRDVAGLAPGSAAFAALLTPQGKILFDFLVLRTEDGFLLDCRRDVAGDLLKRLTFYKLRAKVTLRDLSASHKVYALWGAPGHTGAQTFPDPRLPALGWRLIASGDGDAPEGFATSDLAAYHAHRIACGVPEGGLDFAFGDAFPHEADMDQLHGISFDKGCYVGQEVVSRMQHRGTARTRIVPVTFDGPAPQPGSSVRAGDKSIGTVGSVSGDTALAMIRLDRAARARNSGDTLLCDGTMLQIGKPDWMTIAVPAGDDIEASS